MRQAISVLMALGALVLVQMGGVPSASATAPDASMTVPLKGAELVRLSRPASKIFIADPEVADFQAASARSILVHGRSSGRTTLFALDERDDVILSRTIAVEHDVEAVRALLRAELGTADIAVRSTPAGLVLSGNVAGGGVADHAVTMASKFVGEGEAVINKLQVASPTQVNIRVRVAEMSREVGERFGFNWNAAFDIGKSTVGLLTGRAPIVAGNAFVPSAALRGTAGGSVGASYRNAGTDATALIDALARENLVTVLAEPNLTAVSGETASFIAGGEFPIPIAQDENTLTIQFKQFGVVLDITPTVLSNDRISLRVRPEVSELTEEGAIVLNEITIPAVSVRRTETTVELASGQSFALAGLLQNQTRSELSKLPGLGDLPILGALFRSEQFQRNETELVIIATAYLVEPASAGDVLDPLDEFRPTSQLERFFQMRLARTEPARRGEVGPTGTRLRGEAGFFF